jgi:hypothetical protein
MGDPIDLGMFPPTAALAMLACACVLIGPASAIAQDPAAEVPDIALSEAQPVTTGPSYGIATASGTPPLTGIQRRSRRYVQGDVPHLLG